MEEEGKSKACVMAQQRNQRTAAISMCLQGWMEVGFVPLVGFYTQFILSHLTELTRLSKAGFSVKSNVGITNDGDR